MSPYSTITFKSLKVDTLVHIHDHGLQVTFANAKLQAFVESMIPDGNYRIEVGSSKLYVLRRGYVTFTEFYSGVSHNWSYNVHYLAKFKSYNLNYMYRNVINGDTTVYDTLKHLIAPVFSPHQMKTLPRIFNTLDGEHVDELRTFLKGPTGWCILGEAGLRTMAIKKHEEYLKNNISSDEYNIKNLMTTLYNCENFTTEANLKDHNNRLKSREEILEKYTKDLEQVQGTTYADLQKFVMSDGKTPHSIDYNEADSVCGIFRCGKTYHPTYGGFALFHSALRGQSSHAYIAPNYQLRKSGEDEVTLSSGIKCPFKVSEVIAWLKGEAEAPHSNYGAISIIETYHGERTPYKLLKCGCHYVDPARDLGGEFFELMKATHTVTKEPDTPEVVLTADEGNVQEFIRISIAKLKTQIGYAQTDVENARRDLLNARKYCSDFIADRPNKVIEINTTLDEAKAKKAANETVFQTFCDDFRNETFKGRMEIVASFMNMCMIPRS